NTSRPRSAGVRFASGAIPMSFPGLPTRQQFKALALCSLLFVVACGDKPQQQGMGGDMKVPVSVITVEPTPTEIFVELPGRVEAIKDAEIRARVTGIVTDIDFEQGSDVKEGQL